MRTIRSLLGRGQAIETLEQATMQAILKRYDAGDNEAGRFTAFTRFRQDLETWLLSEGSWSAKFHYLKQLFRLGELRERARLAALEGSPLRRIGNLKQVPKEQLVRWIRELILEGYLDLDDIDPPPLIDFYDYAWHGNPDNYVPRATRKRKYPLTPAERDYLD